jgi:hypothetical protein
MFNLVDKVITSTLTRQKSKKLKSFNLGHTYNCMDEVTVRDGCTEIYTVIQQFLSWKG